MATDAEIFELEGRLRVIAQATSFDAIPAWCSDTISRFNNLDADTMDNDLKLLVRVAMEGIVLAYLEAIGHGEFGNIWQAAMEKFHVEGWE